MPFALVALQRPASSSDCREGATDDGVSNLVVPRISRARSTGATVARVPSSRDATSAPRESRSPRPSRSRERSGPASLYIRGEAWLEKKRLREEELRAEAFQAEVSECTFRPAVPTSARSSFRASTTPTVTPQRARLLFERQLTWRQRLEDERERLRRERRETEESKLRAIQCQSARRRSASVGTAATKEDVFAAFHARNHRWLMAKEERAHVDRLRDAPHQQSLRSDKSPEGRRGASNRNAVPRPLSADGATSGGVSQHASPTDEAPLRSSSWSVMPPDFGSSTSSSASAPFQQPLVVDSAKSDPEKAEREEILQHLQTLRKCLSRSKPRCGIAPTTQKSRHTDGATIHQRAPAAAPSRTRPDEGR